MGGGWAGSGPHACPCGQEGGDRLGSVLGSLTCHGGVAAGRVAVVPTRDPRQGGETESAAASRCHRISPVCPGSQLDLLSWCGGCSDSRGEGPSSSAPCGEGGVLVLRRPVGSLATHELDFSFRVQEFKFKWHLPPPPAPRPVQDGRESGAGVGRG